MCCRVVKGLLNRSTMPRCWLQVKEGQTAAFHLLTGATFLREVPTEGLVNGKASGRVVCCAALRSVVELCPAALRWHCAEGAAGCHK